MPKSIDQLKVVEVAGSPAGGYAGRLFAGWGANVVKASVGDVSPQEPPMDPGLHLFLDHAKQTAVVKREDLRELVGEADVVIESSAPRPLISQTEHGAGLVNIEISPYGSSGPYAQRWSTELTDQAASGHLLLNGDPDREPIVGPAHQVAFASGLHGFIGAVAALIGGREVRGTTVEVSHVQVMASLHQFTLIRRMNGGQLLNRMGNRWAGPGNPCGLYRCIDGHIAIIVPRDDQLERLLAVAGLDHLLTEPGIGHAYDLMHHPTLINDHLRPWFAERPVSETVRLLQDIRVAAAPVSSMSDVLSDPHLLDRGSFITVQGVQMPGPPARIAGLEWRTEPDLDQPAASVADTEEATSSDRAEPVRPLDGVRVIDLTRVWAGPLATMILADLGADVVMVEAPWARGGPTIDQASVRATAYYPDNDPGDQHWNRIGFVNKYSLGKRSIALDLSESVGREALERLIGGADVLIENYSPRVMPQLGLDEARLAEIRPDLIYVTMPGYGRSGPDRERIAYGPVIDSHAGLSMLMGYPGEKGRSAGVAWPDPVAGMHAAAATVVAVLERLANPAKGGGTVEVAQIEATVAMAGAALVDRQLTGTEPISSGNRDRRWAFQSVLPCRGRDRWVAVTVVDRAAWRRLAATVGLDEFKLLDHVDLEERSDEIEDALSNWSSVRGREEIVDLLRGPGVAVALVADADDVLADPHLAACDFWSSTEHASAGTEVWPRTAISFDGHVLEPQRPAPRLGEHNRMLVEEAGLSYDEYSHLVDVGVLATSPPV